MSTALKDNWQWYLGGIGALVLLWLLGPILTPFAVGAGLAYLGDPIVDRLERWGLSRTAGVAVVFVSLILLTLIGTVLIVPMLYQQSLTLLGEIPGWLVWLQDVALPWLGIQLPEGIRLDPAGLKQMIASHWSDASGYAGQIWLRVSQSSALLGALIGNLLLIPIVTFYLLRDWDRLVAWIRDVIPPRWLPRVTRLSHEVNGVLGGFLRGQLSVMLALTVLYSAGLALVGLKLALAIGFLAGMLSFVPYLGFAVGFIAALLAMLVQEHSLLPLVWIAVVFGIGQIVESWWLTPKLVGDRIGLHPVAVIFALLAGGQLFGFVGMLLALPGSAVIAVLLRDAKQQWLRSPLYLRDADHPLPAQIEAQAPPPASHTPDA